MLAWLRALRCACVTKSMPLEWSWPPRPGDPNSCMIPRNWVKMCACLPQMQGGTEGAGCRRSASHHQFPASNQDMRPLMAMAFSSSSISCPSTAHNNGETIVHAGCRLACDARHMHEAPMQGCAQKHRCPLSEATTAFPPQLLARAGMEGTRPSHATWRGEPHTQATPNRPLPAALLCHACMQARQRPPWWMHGSR